MLVNENCDEIEIALRNCVTLGISTLFDVNLLLANEHCVQLARRLIVSVGSHYSHILSTIPSFVTDQLLFLCCARSID